jgi:hypothetical protein
MLSIYNFHAVCGCFWHHEVGHINYSLLERIDIRQISCQRSEAEWGEAPWRSDSE